MSDMEKSHVEFVAVKVCDRAECHGDEQGCDMPDCANPRWRRLSHDEFVRTFKRCPQDCDYVTEKVTQVTLQRKRNSISPKARA